MAAYLALGQPLLEAVQGARDFVRAALAAGADVRTGAGGGPLNHGHAPRGMKLKPWP
jgi:hydroxymethylpyrimidine/phosphomethylpyrimidine kinase